MVSENNINLTGMFLAKPLYTASVTTLVESPIEIPTESTDAEIA
jgi:hypothetical protein